MMKRFTLLTFVIALFVTSNSFSQARIENRMSFHDAESWLLFEDYKEALPIYLRLNQIFPKNYNIKYRVGQCYTNIPGEKDKAIVYLEDAVKNINPRYRKARLKETRAPYDALYYLANAYRINNQLDKAVETYNEFKKNLNPKVYDSVIVNQQIRSCYNARELMAVPLFIREQNLGNNINEANSEYDPVISGDENVMVFSRSEAFYEAIMYATRTDGKWNPPLNMNELLKVDFDYYPTSLSADGKTLYMYSSSKYDGVISSSTFENNAWSTPVRLNDNINTKYWESHATISHDNKKLYFTSNRKGTLGGLDIYVSVRDKTGDWGPAVNLGPVINTPYNEETPFLSSDDKTLFFSSRGHFNMGGYDIFYSTLLDNGEWSIPVNAGYPLNSTDDDVFFNPVREGYEGYFAKYDPEGFGRQDIYKIEIFSENHPRKFLVKGLATIADLLAGMTDSVKISTLNIRKPNQTIVVYSNPKTGEFEFVVPQGNYEITYEARGSEKVKRALDLPLTFPSDSFILPGIILPRADFVTDMNVDTGRTITVQKGDSILFPPKVEPNSELVVKHRVARKPIAAKTDGNIKPEDLNNKAQDIPEETDPAILIIREKINAYSENASAGSLIRRSVTLTDEKRISKAGKWLQSFYNESVRQGMTGDQLAQMFAAISSMPGTKLNVFTGKFAQYSEEPLASWLKSIDLNKEKIKSPSDLILFVFNNKDKGNITDDMLFNSLAKMIASENIPDDIIRSQPAATGGNKLWILWVLLGGGLILLLFILRKKNKKEKKVS